MAEGRRGFDPDIRAGQSLVCEALFGLATCHLNPRLETVEKWNSTGRVTYTLVKAETQINSVACHDRQPFIEFTLAKARDW